MRLGGHLPFLSLVVGLTTGCPAPTPTPPAACRVEAAAAATPVGGDANGDGLVDVSDGTYLARAQLAGGPAPVCAAAVDLVPDGTVNLGDVPAIWYAVGPRTAPYLPTVGADTCPPVARTVTPPCAATLALGLDTPAEVAGADGVATEFPVTVTLTSPELAVEAWSFTLTASGCSLVAGGTAGTDAAHRGDDPPGRRDRGMAWQGLTPEEAHVLTVLDWRTQAALPPGEATLHTFTVAATPGAGCATCTLTLVDGDPASGSPAVVAVEGWRYTPGLARAEVSVCPG